MSRLARIAVAAAGALFAAPATGAAQTLIFRDQAAEVSAASRFLRAYGIVTSTFRTAAHNRAVGGVPNSYHLLDRAIDLARRPGVSHWMIDTALRRAGFTLVESLDEHDHSHFAFAPVTIAQPTAQNPSAPVPPLAASAPPRVAADIHGTLNLDLLASPGSGGEEQAASR